jgi:SPP1 gp7 family putative phage head morphogenesis protein
MSANEYLEDWSNTNAINILRVEAGIRKKVIKELETLEQDLVKRIAVASPSKKGNLQMLLKDTSQTINESYKTITKNTEKDLDKLARTQIKGTKAALNGAIGVPLLRKSPTETQVNAVMRRSAIEGHSSGKWWQEQDKALRFKFEGQMRQGYLAGEDVGDLAKRIRGTKANNYKDGIMNVSKAQAETLARSSVQTVSNEARIEAILENDDIVGEIRWLATLDSRTTKTCMALDGKRWSLPEFEPVDHDKEFPGPTAHWGCRSTQVPVLPSLSELTGKKIKSLGDKEFQAAVDDRLKEMGMSEEQRKGAVVRSRASMDGQIPKDKTYGEWLKTKPNEFQNKVLGINRANAFRSGQLQISDLTNQDNRPLTLEQLDIAVTSDGQEFAIETEGVIQPQEETLQDKIDNLPQGTLSRKLANGEREIAAALIIDDLGDFQPITNSKLLEYQKAHDNFLTEHLSTEFIATDELKLGTSKVFKSDVEAYAKDPTLPKNNIVVIRDTDGKFKIIEGHHQWTAAKLNGDDKVKVTMIDVEQYNAEKAINDVLNNPKTKGNKLLGEALTDIKKQNKGISDTSLLDQAKGAATEKQAQLTKASNLSKAKKAISEGKNPSPKGLEAIKSLSGAETAEFYKQADDLGASKKLTEQIAQDKTILETKLKEYKDGTSTQKLAYEKHKKLYPDGYTDTDVLKAKASLEQENSIQAYKEIAEAMEKPNAATKKAFQDLTGIKPEKWDQIESGDFSVINEKLKVLTAEKQEQLTQASYLSKAKKKLTEGKVPSDKELQIIVNLSPEENAAFYQGVNDANQKKKLEKQAKVTTSKIESLEAQIAATKKEIEDFEAGATPAKLDKKAEEKVIANKLKDNETSTKFDKDVKNLDLVFPEPENLEFVKQLNGSTKPQLMVDPDTGKQWVVKSDSFDNNLDSKALINEATADSIYREMGAKVPGSKTFVKDGVTYKVAEYVDNSKELGKWESGESEKAQAKVNRQLQEHFVLDSLLGNRDVAGQSNDNILIRDGVPYRIDNGASLAYRAQGAKKDSKAWGKVVGELESMRDPSIAAGNGKTAKIFEGISQNEINDQIREIVKRKDNLVEIVKSTATAAETKVFKQRIEYLESLLPAEQKPAIQEASRKGKQAALDVTKQPRIVAEKVKNARINGYSIDLGSSHVEDMQAIGWQETTTDGKKKTFLQFKVTDDGAKAIREKLPQDKLKKVTETRVQEATGPQKHPADKNYQSKMMAMVKTTNHHKDDKQFNAASVVQFQKAKDEIKAEIAKENKKGFKKIDVEKMNMLLHYEEQADKLQKLYDHVQKNNDIPSNLTVAIPNESYLFEPPKVKKKPDVAAEGFSGTISNTFEARSSTFKNGQAKNDGQLAVRIENTAADIYKLRLEDGTSVEFIDRLEGVERRRGLALEGRVTIEIEGEVNADKITQAVGALDRLGVDTKPADANYKEMVWLSKTVNVHNDTNTAGWKKAIAEPDIEKRIKNARTFIEKQYETKVPQRGTEGYTADGVANSFDEGRKASYRADITRRQIETDPRTRNIALHHRTYKEMSITLDSMLQSGGDFTSTGQRLRKGVVVERPGGQEQGASPITDIHTGGADSSFTRLRKKEEFDNLEGGMYFKAGNLARADAVIHRGDVWGAISKNKLRLSTIDQIDELAKEATKYGMSDETDFKGTIFIPDEIDFFLATSEKQRDDTIAVLKKNGLQILPDGRRAEEVVFIKGEKLPIIE